MSAPPSAAGREIVLALAGQPNVGKSTIFNLLTGLSQHVGNWPGKTVTRAEGGFWRYREMLPVRLSENVVSLGEVMTPLIDAANSARKHGSAGLIVKDEGRLPTGSSPTASRSFSGK